MAPSMALRILSHRPMRKSMVTLSNFLRINVSQKLVASVMHENGMFSICGGAKQQYLQSVKQRRNLLQQKFTVSHPNEVWVSDVTFYRLRKRKYYICVILDLYARKVIAWKIGIKNSTQLTKKHLQGSISCS